MAGVEGDVLVLATPEGTRRVRLAPTTRVVKQVPADRGEIAPGQLVVVGEEAAGDESVASAVQILGGQPGAPAPGGARGGE